MTALTWRVRATVLRIIDGDTFAANLDLGWGVQRLEVRGALSRVRILGRNAPERGKPGFVEATAALAAVLPPGAVVWLTSHSLDSFGRALAEVHMLDGRALTELLP